MALDDFAVKFTPKATPGADASQPSSGPNLVAFISQLCEWLDSTAFIKCHVEFQVRPYWIFIDNQWQKWLSIKDDFMVDFADTLKQCMQSELVAFWKDTLSEMMVRQHT